MKLIAGLGNFPKEYDNTRHNIGFEIIDRYNAQVLNGDNFKQEKLGLVIKRSLYGESVLFVKPQTYMNLSGECISKLANYYKIVPEDILVLHDEVDLCFGDVKISTNKGTGGHNGISNIISFLGKGFYRVRIGVKNDDLQTYGKKNFVLAKFKEEEIKEIDKIYKDSKDIIDLFIKGDISKALNVYNRRKR